MNQNCTFSQTRTTHTYQQWATCRTCFKNKELGACVECLKTCHAGHDLGEITYGNFFCDCGAKGLCDLNSRMKKLEETYSSLRQPIRSNNLLAVKLFNLMEPENGTVYSPLSIFTILGMLQHASVGNTFNQIFGVFERLNTVNELMTISNVFNNTTVSKLSNVIVVNETKPISKYYTDTMGDLAMIRNDDFSKPDVVARNINSHIETNTNGMIKDLVKKEHIGMDTIMVLVNTIYFKSNWKYSFDKSSTFDDGFMNNAKGKTCKVPMMCGEENDFNYFQDEIVEVVELPYNDNLFVMGFILPKGKESQTCNYLGQPIPFAKQKIIVRIPKFTQRKNTDLVPVLKDLGASDMFDRNLANFPIVPTGAYVSVMIHEAVIIVDEAGTEASGATMALLSEKCLRRSFPKIFNANHTFGYYIKHISTGAFVFVGEYHGDD